MKTYTLVNKENRSVVLTITAKNWDEAAEIIHKLGFYLDEWDY